MFVDVTAIARLQDERVDSTQMKQIRVKSPVRPAPTIPTRTRMIPRFEASRHLKRANLHRHRKAVPRPDENIFRQPLEFGCGGFKPRYHPKINQTCIHFFAAGKQIHRARRTMICCRTTWPAPNAITRVKASRQTVSPRPLTDWIACPRSRNSVMSNCAIIAQRISLRAQALQHCRCSLVNQDSHCAIIAVTVRSLASLNSCSSGPERWDTHSGNPDFVLSLARGMQVIEAFQRKTEGLSVSEISLRTGLSRAVVRRLLITLEMLGYAARSGRLYRLSPRILQLGFSYLSSNSLEALGFPVIQHVTEVLHESSSIGILQGDEIVYVARSPAQRVMSIGLSVGSRLPAYCTSMGRVMLATLPAQDLTAFLKRAELKRLTPKTITEKREFTRVIERVRADGYALVDEELEIGLRSIAVPVQSRSGLVIGAMNSGVHAARVSRQQLIANFLPVLRKQAGLLGSMLA